MTFSVLWFFLKLPWVGLQCVIVVFPDHTHTYLLFCPFVLEKNFLLGGLLDGYFIKFVVVVVFCP